MAIVKNCVITTTKTYDKNRWMSVRQHEWYNRVNKIGYNMDFLIWICSSKWIQSKSSILYTSRSREGCNFDFMLLKTRCYQQSIPFFKLLVNTLYYLGKDYDPDFSLVLPSLFISYICLYHVNLASSSLQQETR